MKIIVPVKSNSERLENKNFKEFSNGLSLFDLRMMKLLKVFDKKDIYVSSENPEVASYCVKYDVNFIIRDIALTVNQIGMSSVIVSIAKQVGLQEDEDLIWSQVTEPFFDKMEDCMNTWENNKTTHDSLVVVKQCKNFFLNDGGMPINFHFGLWHKCSQDLPKMYLLPFTFMIIKGKSLFDCHYYIGKNPYLFKSKDMIVDIDDEEDFKLAQHIYEYKQCLK